NEILTSHGGLPSGRVARPSGCRFRCNAIEIISEQVRHMSLKSIFLLIAAVGVNFIPCNRAHAVLFNNGVVGGFADVNFGGSTGSFGQTVDWPNGQGSHFVNVSDQTFTNGPDTMVAGYSASVTSAGLSANANMAADYSVSGPEPWSNTQLQAQ